MFPFCKILLVVAVSSDVAISASLVSSDRPQQPRVVFLSSSRPTDELTDRFALAVTSYPPVGSVGARSGGSCGGGNLNTLALWYGDRQPGGKFQKRWKGAEFSTADEKKAVDVAGAGADESGGTQDSLRPAAKCFNLKETNRLLARTYLRNGLYKQISVKAAQQDPDEEQEENDPNARPALAFIPGVDYYAKYKMFGAYGPFYEYHHPSKDEVGVELEVEESERRDHDRTRRQAGRDAVVSVASRAQFEKGRRVFREPFRPQRLHQEAPDFSFQKGYCGVDLDEAWKVWDREKKNGPSVVSNSVSTSVGTTTPQRTEQDVELSSAGSGDNVVEQDTDFVGAVENTSSEGSPEDTSDAGGSIASTATKTEIFKLTPYAAENPAELCTLLWPRVDAYCSGPEEVLVKDLAVEFKAGDEWRKVADSSASVSAADGDGHELVDTGSFYLENVQNPQLRSDTLTKTVMDGDGRTMFSGTRTIFVRSLRGEMLLMR